MGTSEKPRPHIHQTSKQIPYSIKSEEKNRGPFLLEILVRGIPLVQTSNKIPWISDTLGHHPVPLHSGFLFRSHIGYHIAFIRRGHYFACYANLKYLYTCPSPNPC